MEDEKQQALKAIEGIVETKTKGFMVEVEKIVEKSNAGLTTQKDFEDANAKLDVNLKTLSENQAKLQKAFEEQIVNAKNQYGSGEAKLKSQTQVINEFLKKGEFSDLETALHKQKSFEIEVVKADQMLSSLGAGVIIPQRTIQEIIKPPFAPWHMEDLVDRGGTTNVNAISYTQQATYTDGTAMTAEGAVLSDTNQTFTEVYDFIRKIATREVFSSEILRNMPRLLTYLLPTMVEKLKIYKDSQILFGTNAGSPAQLRGLFPSAQTFAYSASQMGQKVKAPNMLDVIVKGALLATNLFHKPNAVLVNPADYSDLLLEKTTYNEYVFENMMIITDRVQLEIKPHPMIPNGNILIGAFNTGCELITQFQPTIEFSEHERFSEDKIVARIKT
jgi:HK97 family phage major capsid protein